MRVLDVAAFALAALVLAGCGAKRAPAASSTVAGHHEIHIWMRISHPHLATNLELVGENAIKNSDKFGAKAAAKQTPDERVRSERARAEFVRSVGEKHYLRALFRSVEESRDFGRYGPLVRSWVSETTSTTVLAGRAKWVQRWQTPEGETEAQNYVTSLRENGSFEQRLALIRRIETSWDEAGLLLASMNRMLSDLEALMKQTKADASARDWAMVGKAHEDARANIRPGMVTTLLLAYQKVDDEKLRRAADFWESPAGRWYVSELHRGVDACFDRLLKDYQNAIDAEREVPADRP